MQILVTILWPNFGRENLGWNEKWAVGSTRKNHIFTSYWKFKTTVYCGGVRTRIGPNTCSSDFYFVKASLGWIPHFPPIFRVTRSCTAAKYIQPSLVRSNTSSSGITKVSKIYYQCEQNILPKWAKYITKVSKVYPPILSEIRHFFIWYYQSEQNISTHLQWDPTLYPVLLPKWAVTAWIMRWFHSPIFPCSASWDIISHQK